MNSGVKWRGVWYDYRLTDNLRDEAPAAYKDIRAVLKAQRELAQGYPHVTTGAQLQRHVKNVRDEPLHWPTGDWRDGLAAQVSRGLRGGFVLTDLRTVHYCQPSNT